MAKVPRAVIAAFFYIENQSTAVGINKSRAMAREQLLMNTIEPAVTENHHDVFWLELYLNPSVFVSICLT